MNLGRNDLLITAARRLDAEDHIRCAGLCAFIVTVLAFSQWIAA